jgi:hypothetical protein
MLDSLTIRGLCEYLFILCDLGQKHVNVIFFVCAFTDLALENLPLLFVVFINRKALSLELFDYQIYTFIGVLHDHFEFERFNVIYLAPDKGYGVWVVQIALDLLQSWKCKPSHQTCNVLYFVVWF